MNTHAKKTTRESFLGGQSHGPRRGAAGPRHRQRVAASARASCVFSTATCRRRAGLPRPGRRGKLLGRAGGGPPGEGDVEGGLERNSIAGKTRTKQTNKKNNPQKKKKTTTANANPCQYLRKFEHNFFYSFFCFPHKGGKKA